MAGISGILQLSDTDRSFVNTIGQQVVYDAIQQYLAEHNAALQAAIGLFVGQTTELFKFRYKLPGGGYLQARGGQAQTAAVKAYGQWDVALPLNDWGASFGGDQISLAYMTIQELNAHLDTITAQNVNTVRLEILKALLDSVSYTFTDPINGSLSVVPLANGDSVVYPPVTGSDVEATDSHYSGTNYTSANISDVNNPFKTLRAELIGHFGGPQQGGENIIAVINSAQTDKVAALADFVDFTDRYVNPGSSVAQLLNLPAGVPGRIIGRTNGCWVSEWDFIPADYIYGQMLDAPAPLAQRVDPADTGLPRGLSLVAEHEHFPLQSAHYQNRFGFAVVNRLNGVAMQLVASTTYSVPTGFSH